MRRRERPVSPSLLEVTQRGSPLVYEPRDERALRAVLTRLLSERGRKMAAMRRQNEAKPAGEDCAGQEARRRLQAIREEMSKPVVTKSVREAASPRVKDYAKKLRGHFKKPTDN